MMKQEVGCFMVPKWVKNLFLVVLLPTLFIVLLSYFEVLKEHLINATPVFGPTYAVFVAWYFLRNMKEKAKKENRYI